MHRRTFMLGGLAALTAVPSVASIYITPPLKLCLHHTHTSERLELDYSRGQIFTGNIRDEFNYFLRDFRTEQAWYMDPQLLDILYDLRHYSQNSEGVFEIISGYRSPATNARLRRQSHGVARNSLHQDGKAIDIRLRGTPTGELRAMAVEMRRGGVGYYPRSNFMHIDTGAVRYW